MTAENVWDEWVGGKRKWEGAIASVCVSECGRHPLLPTPRPPPRALGGSGLDEFSIS